MRINQKVGIGAEYTFFKKVNGELIPLLDGAKSKNIIPSVFLQYLVNNDIFRNNSYQPTMPSTSTTPSNNFLYLCQRLAVGTGSTTPSLADTALVAQVAQINAPNVVTEAFSYNDVDKYVQWKISATFTFGLGAINANLSEIGMYSWTRVSSTATFMSRTLIKDGLGNPTTLTITSEDQLVVNVEFFVRVGYEFKSAVQNYNGVDYTLDYRLYFDPSFSNLPRNPMFYCIAAIDAPTSSAAFMAAVTGTSWTMATTEQGSVPGLVSCSLPPVTPLNPSSTVKKLRFRLGLADGNFAGGLAGIMAIVRFSQGTSNPNRVSWHFQFTPKLPKDNTFILELEVFTEFGNL